ncbi:hypothetical protein B0A48_17283 [Cryoendolithus antarcticus]|uniref:Uncharacterized protein n=1 Tax=Cryoendolithus antarcticus TaxID=1507870 RepID=A0A1V8SC39_9PEZI|nr:hypothetical protein B0A48_17283 [Cryoendolithus antarcticus]
MPDISTFPITDAMSTSLSQSRAFYNTLDGDKLRVMSFSGRMGELSESLQQAMEAASDPGDDIPAMKEGMWALRRVLTAWHKYPSIGQRMTANDPASPVIMTIEYYYTAKEVVKPAPVGSLRFQIADLLATAVDADSAGMANLSVKEMNGVLTHICLVVEQLYWIWYNMVEDLGSEVADDTPEVEAATKTFSAVLYRQPSSDNGSILERGNTPPPTTSTRSAPPTTVTQTITDTDRVKPGRKTGVQGKIASKGEKWLNDEYGYVQEHYFNATSRPTHAQLYRDFNAHFAGTAVQLRENGPVRYRDAWVPKSQDKSDAKARDEDLGHRTYNGLQQFVMKLQKIDSFEPKINWAYDAAATPAAAQSTMATAALATTSDLGSASPVVSAVVPAAEMDERVKEYLGERGDFNLMYIEQDE